MIFRGYLIFRTTSDAFECARMLSMPSFQSFGLCYEHCPSPKQFSKDCTLAIYLESSREDYEEAEIAQLEADFLQKLSNIEHKFFRI